MWEILFATINILLFAISLVRSKFDFIYPPVLFFGVWSFSSTGYACMSSYWDAPLHLNTFIIMLVSSLLFLLGCEITAWHTNPINIKVQFIKLNKIVISGKVLIFFFLVELLACYCIFDHQYRLATAVNSSIASFDIPKIMVYARYATTGGGYSNERLYVNVVRIMNVLPFLLFYDYIINKNNRTKFLLRFQLLQCCFIPVALTLTSVKMPFFGVVFGYLVIYFALHKRGQGDYTFLRALNVIKKLFFVGIGLIAFLAIINTFLFSRITFDGIQLITSYIMKYVSGSIPAFDYYVNHISAFEASSSVFAPLTFQSIYIFLDNLGLLSYYYTVDIGFIPNMGHGFSTNVFTLYYNYISDFNVLGIFMSLLNGLIYGYMYCCVSKKQDNSNAILFYAVMALPLTVSFFGEVFWSKINTNVVQLFLLMIFTFLFKLEHLNLKMDTK